MFFLSDSLLYILVKKKEAWVLFIPNFKWGNFWEEGDKVLKEDESTIQYSTFTGIAINQKKSGEKMLEEMSWNSEVENGVVILKGDISHLVTNKNFNFT